ncbi:MULTISPECIES: hypothetical protein [Bacillota]|uniref:hypothetical protein n=1 Tax=Bacillota TaxID=1239 RepID=UPI0039F0B458
MTTIVLESRFEGVPFGVFRINEGPHAGKYRAFIQPFGIQTSIQDTIGKAVDRAIVNITKQIN